MPRPAGQIPKSPQLGRIWAMERGHQSIGRLMVGGNAMRKLVNLAALAVIAAALLVGGEGALGRTASGLGIGAAGGLAVGAVAGGPLVVAILVGSGLGAAAGVATASHVLPG